MERDPKVYCTEEGEQGSSPLRKVDKDQRPMSRRGGPRKVDSRGDVHMGCKSRQIDLEDPTSDNGPSRTDYGPFRICPRCTTTSSTTTVVDRRPLLLGKETTDIFSSLSLTDTRVMWIPHTRHDTTHTKGSGRGDDIRGSKDQIVVT